MAKRGYCSEFGNQTRLLLKKNFILLVRRILDSNLTYLSHVCSIVTKQRQLFSFWCPSSLLQLYELSQLLAPLFSLPHFRCGQLFLLDFAIKENTERNPQIAGCTCCETTKLTSASHTRLQQLLMVSLLTRALELDDAFFNLVRVTAGRSVFCHLRTQSC